jgi:hypothetical protein
MKDRGLVDGKQITVETEEGNPWRDNAKKKNIDSEL